MLLLDSESVALLAGCPSFESRYEQVKAEVELYRSHFNGGGHIDWQEVVSSAIAERVVLETCDDHMLDRVSGLGPQENDAIDGEVDDPVIVPVTNVQEYLDARGSKLNGDDHVGSYDIGIEIGKLPTASTYSVELNTSDRLETDVVYRSNVRSLNAEQRLIFDHVLHWLKRSAEEPLHIFLSGGAGVGKSVVTRVIYQAAARWFRSGPSDNPLSRKVLLVAPTGSAAFTVGGQTIHTGVRIPMNQKGYRSLSVDKQAEARAVDGDVQLIIIDEISLVPSSMLNTISLRLRDLKGNSLPFGGIHVIVVGDLFQLAPVGGTYVFDVDKEGLKALAPNLFRELFAMYELHTVMRQKHREFAETLNRVREGKHTKDDLERLQRRVLYVGDPTNAARFPNYSPLVRHMFYKNDDLNTHNDSVLALVKGALVLIPAADYVMSRFVSNTQKEYFLARAKSLKAAETSCLASLLKFKVGLIVEVTLNISDDGLFNGAWGFVRAFDQDETGTVHTIWVEFADSNIGRRTRSLYEAVYRRFPDRINTWTPIHRTNRQFRVTKSSLSVVLRKQFPLRPATAISFHRSQGQSLQAGAMRFAGDSALAGKHYVGLSRLVSEEGLYIIGGLAADKIATAPSVVTEMARLREQQLRPSTNLPAVSVNGSFTVVAHNARSLHAHLQDVQRTEAFTSSDILFISETRFIATDAETDVEIPGFSAIRCDSPFPASSRPSRGCAFYVKNESPIHVEKHTVRTTSFAEVVVVTLRFKGAELANMTFNVVGIYREANSTSFPSFLDFLTASLMESAALTAAYTVYCGDFNVDMIGNDSCREQLQELMHTNDMRQLVKTYTTDNRSLIDHVWAQTNVVHSELEILETYWSDHQAVRFRVLHPSAEKLTSETFSAPTLSGRTIELIIGTHF